MNLIVSLRKFSIERGVSYINIKLDNQIENVNVLNDKCLNSFKNVTYELEKITDILIRLIEQKDSSSPFLRFLRKYKSRIEEAKSYVIKELNTDEFSIDVRNGYVKVMGLLKDFSKNIVQVAQKNNLEVIAKVSMKLPQMTMELCSNFIKLMKTNSVLLKDDIKTNSIQSTNENLDYNILLTESDFFSHFGTGFTNIFSNIWGFFKGGNIKENSNIFSGLIDKLLAQFKQIGTDYNAAFPNGLFNAETGAQQTSHTLTRLGQFFGGSGFMGLVGNIAAIAIIWWGIRKLYKTIKWKVFNRR